ncbi:hypothetical protein GCM10010441_01940 [Kitasatospora paracochleata]|uniref:Rhomboid family intramembrane serine protease n=1 Tax=Kitasatospora paracochleata TaxID=58354 RepID=A0ABT1J2M4_9ACTN|nr:hypothetical protein [Kitasatospora paracochleata]MCP2311685.1 hypothetical protein [Kitasatospora paracochleata]
MGAIVFNVTTAALMVMMVNCGLGVVGRDTLRGRPVPWTAVGLTALAVGGVLLQLAWPGAMDALDADPARSGWWREFTSVFLQNGGLFGGLWNLLTLAAVAALAEWHWGGRMVPAFFLAGIVLPGRLDTALGLADGPSTDPRNFAGSSGATYFLGATLALALLTRTRLPKEIALAVGVPVLGLAMWLAQDNGHGLVSVYGFVLGAVAWAVRRRRVGRPRSGAPAGGAGRPDGA